ncbi:hypothetical protein KY289_025273 [Solanum tuberosum]|nr:hypothetical protein KY289_025273 [Solanum tuberosum]
MGKELRSDRDLLKGNRLEPQAKPRDVAESSGAGSRASDTGLCQLDPKDLLGLNTKVMEGPKQSINKNTPPKSWELTTFMETNGRSEAEIAIEETANMISQSKDCNAKDNETSRQTEGESTPKTSDQSGTREVELQIQQVHQPEPVDMHISTQLEVTETKAPN